MADEVVVDTNVIVKCFLAEADSEHADSLLEAALTGSVAFVAPDFLVLEFANVLWLKAGQGDISDRQAEEMMTEFLGLSSFFEIVPSLTVLVPVYHLARAIEHTVYDAAFLVLAEERRIPFITADAKFFRKARGLSRRPVLLPYWKDALS